MVKRTTINKVQLLIGIIILLISIVGIISSYNWYKNINERYYEDSETGLFDKTGITLYYVNMAVIIFVSSILSVFILSLFILQGLLNMSENK